MVPSGDLLAGEYLALILKLVLGTLAFVWILWTVRSVNPRAVGMMLTFPALNGVVLLTVTDKLVSEMVAGIFPLMFFNGMLAALFIALRRGLGDRQGLAIAICLLIWAVLAAVLEWRAVWVYRWTLAVVAGLLILLTAGAAFWHLRETGARLPPLAEHQETLRDFAADRAPRVLLFFVSFLVVSLVAYAWSDVHSLVGRLSALPLVPLFVLHWAVNARRADLDELRVAALIGPVAAAGFLFLFSFTLSFIRDDAGALHPAYWAIGLVALLVEWELTRLAIIGMARLTYRR
jgi:hypothetical protein